MDWEWMLTPGVFYAWLIRVCRLRVAYLRMAGKCGLWYGELKALHGQTHSTFYSTLFNIVAYNILSLYGHLSSIMLNVFEGYWMTLKEIWTCSNQSSTNQKILILVEKSVAKMLHNYSENKSIFAKASRGLHSVVQSCHFNFLEGKLEKPIELTAAVKYFMEIKDFLWEYHKIRKG